MQYQKNFSRIDFEIYSNHYDDLDDLTQQLTELQNTAEPFVRLVCIKENTGDYYIGAVNKYRYDASMFSLNVRYIVMSRDITPHEGLKSSDVYKRRGLKQTFDSKTIEHLKNHVEFYDIENKLSLLSVDFGGKIKNFVVYKD